MRARIFKAKMNSRNGSNTRIKSTDWRIFEAMSCKALNLKDSTYCTLAVMTQYSSAIFSKVLRAIASG